MWFVDRRRELTIVSAARRCMMLTMLYLRMTLCTFIFRFFEWKIRLQKHHRRKPQPPCLCNQIHTCVRRSCTSNSARTQTRDDIFGECVKTKTRQKNIKFERSQSTSPNKRQRCRCEVGLSIRQNMLAARVEWIKFHVQWVLIALQVELYASQAHFGCVHRRSLYNLKRDYQ